MERISHITGNEDILDALSKNFKNSKNVVIYRHEFDHTIPYDIPSNKSIKYYKTIRNDDEKTNIIEENIFKKSFDKREWLKKYEPLFFTNDEWERSNQLFENWKESKSNQIKSPIDTDMDYFDLDFGKLDLNDMDLDLDFSKLDLSDEESLDFSNLNLQSDDDF